MLFGSVQDGETDPRAGVKRRTDRQIMVPYYVRMCMYKHGNRKGHASYLQCRGTLVQQGVDLCGEHFLIQK